MLNLFTRVEATTVSPLTSSFALRSFFGLLCGFSYALFYFQLFVRLTDQDRLVGLITGSMRAFCLPEALAMPFSALAFFRFSDIVFRSFSSAVVYGWFRPIQSQFVCRLD